MAKGSARRTYNRDARGRFASTGSSAPRRGAVKPGGGTLKARASLARSRSRLAAADTADRSLRGTLSRRSQKGAVTRGKKALAQAKKEALVRLRVGLPKGVIRKSKGKGRKAPPAVPPAVTVTQAPQSGAASSGRRRIIRVPRVQRPGVIAPPLQLSRMLALGGSRWQKNGMDRVYFNNLAGLAGMSYSKYKSGYVSNADIKGRGITNSKASEILAYLGDSKVFYDRGTRRVTIQGARQVRVRGAQQNTAEAMLREAARKITRGSRMQSRVPRRRRGR